METRNLFTQIALLTLAGVILFKVFQIDANQKIIKNNINKSLTEIASAEENLAAAQDEITKLEKKIEVFKMQQELLEEERKTIVKNYQNAQEEDREVLKQIKEEIESNNEELDRLRNLNNEFGGGEFPTLTLKSLVEDALKIVEEAQAK